MSFKHCHWAVVVFLCKLTPSFSYFRLVARLLQWLPRQGPQIRGEEMKIRWLTQNLVLLKTPDEESSLEYVDSWANNDKQKLNLSGLTQGNLNCDIAMHCFRIRSRSNKEYCHQIDNKSLKCAFLCPGEILRVPSRPSRRIWHHQGGADQTWVAQKLYAVLLKVYFK